MKGTDYQFPPEWPSMSDEEKSEWFVAERHRRQAMRQDTNFERHYKKAEEKLSLREKFRNFVKLGK